MQRDAATPQLSAGLLSLAGYRLDLVRGELLDAGGEPADLRPQALKVLCVLAEQAGHVVGKDDLMQRVWGQVVVTEDSLVQAVGDIRRLLGDAGHQTVRTVPRRGYMLVPPPAPAAAQAAAGLLAEERDVAAVAERRAPAPDSPPREPALRAPALLGMALLLLAAFTLAWAARSSWRERAVPMSSLAILPFQAEPAGSAEDWFVDALGSDLHTSIARGTGLYLVGHSTMVRSYGRQGAGHRADPRRVAHDMGVAFVLSGRARREGEQLRLALELLDGRSGRVTWAQTYDIHRAELPRAIADMAGGIAKSVYIEMGQAIGDRIARLAPAEAEADDLAMHGFAIFLRDVGPEGFAKARELFEQALARDPQSVRALGGVSLSNTMSVIFAFAPDPPAALRRAEQTLAQLEQVAPNHQLTWYARAALVYPRADWPTLLAVSEQTVARFPNDPTSHHHRCSALLRLARPDESIAACQQALRISPLDSRAPIWHGLIGFNHFIAGRYAPAAEHAQRMVSANRRLPFYSLLLAGALARDGRVAEARRWLTEFRQRPDALDSTGVVKMWPGEEPGFVTGRNTLVATLRELGLP